MGIPNVAINMELTSVVVFWHHCSSIQRIIPIKCKVFLTLSINVIRGELPLFHFSQKRLWNLHEILMRYLVNLDSSVSGFFCSAEISCHSKIQREKVLTNRVVPKRLFKYQWTIKSKADYGFCKLSKRKRQTNFNNNNMTKKWSASLKYRTTQTLMYGNTLLSKMYFWI